MSKKLVVKLIATVMAMTMVVGMGMTAFAMSCQEEMEDINSKAGELVALNPTSTPEHINEWESGSECYNGTTISQALELASSLGSVQNPGDHEHNPDGSECTSGSAASAIQTIYDNFMTKYNSAKNNKLVSDGSQYHACGDSSSTASSSTSTPKAPTAEEKHEEYAKAVEATVAAEVAAPVVTFTSAAAVNAIPAEAKTTGAAYNLSSVTTTQGFVAAVNKIAKDTPAKAMSVYSSKPIAMNAASIDAVTNSGKAFEYTFSYQGHIYKITIPAGAKINMNGQRFAGPLYIGAVLGTTQVIK